jgi:hypothetical protein
MSLTTAPLPPRVAIEVVDKALVLGKRHFWSLLRLALIPFLLASGVTHLYVFTATTIIGRSMATLVVYVFFGLMEAATVAGAWDLLHGAPLDVADVWRRVRRRAITIPIAFTIKIVLAVLGVLALVVPGLYFLAIYFAVPAVNVIEGLGLRAGFLRSRRLALGSIPGILLSIGAFWIIAGVVGVVVPRGLTLLGVPRVSLIRTVVSLSWALVITPFRAALSAAVYLELRVRKEGYDLQSLLQSLPSAV